MTCMYCSSTKLLNKSKIRWTILTEMPKIDLFLRNGLNKNNNNRTSKHRYHCLVLPTSNKFVSYKPLSTISDVQICWTENEDKNVQNFKNLRQQGLSMKMHIIPSWLCESKLYLFSDVQIMFRSVAHCDKGLKRKMSSHFAKKTIDKLMKKVSLCPACPSVPETQPDGIRANSALEHNYGNILDIYFFLRVNYQRCPVGIFFFSRPIIFWEQFKGTWKPKTVKGKTPVEKNT